MPKQPLHHLAVLGLLLAQLHDCALLLGDSRRVPARRASGYYAACFGEHAGC